MRQLLTVSTILSCLLVYSCDSRKSFATITQYFKYVNDPKNGFVKSKEYDKIGFKVRYLAPDYFTANEFSNNKTIRNSQIDSIYKLYSKNRTFVLTIGTAKDKGADVMLQGINSEDEYRQRFEFLNFNIGSYIYLKTDKNKYYPSLTNMENVYGLSKSRNINLVFSPLPLNDDLLESEEYEIVYEDIVYSTGVSHFIFEKSDIDKKFSLKFLK